MSIFLPRTVALACAYLFSASIITFAQTNSVTQTSYETVNVASDSLERAVERGVVEGFFPRTLTPISGAAYLSDLYLPPDASLFDQFLLAQANPQNQPKPTEPTLGDLGFPTDQTKGNAAEQARLDKRSHMLKIHQRLGLLTTIPLAVTILSSGLASGKATSSTGRDVHAAIGGVATGMYFATAYYSIFAPKVPGTATRGSVRLHKILAMIHGPGMILTPILGVMAYEQKSRGERVHGLAAAHGGVAAVTSIAYGLAIASVSFKF